MCLTKDGHGRAHTDRVVELLCVGTLQGDAAEGPVDLLVDRRILPVRNAMDAHEAADGRVGFDLSGPLRRMKLAPGIPGWIVQPHETAPELMGIMGVEVEQALWSAAVTVAQLVVHWVTSE